MSFTDKHGYIFIDTLYQIIGEKENIKIDYIIKKKKNKEEGEKKKARNVRRSN